MSDPAVLSIAPAQARALASPTRRELVGYLARAGRPVTVDELSTHLGLNHTGVRKHLARLVAAGLIEESLEARTSPGRPRLLYRPSHRALAPSGASYERLATLLAEALASGGDPVEVGRRAGRATGAPVLDSASSPLNGLTGRLAAEGFEPVVRRRGGHIAIVLGHCPYEAAARVNPKAVCSLHLGLAQGTAEAIGHLRVDGLAPRDPSRAGCRLTVVEIPVGPAQGRSTAL